MTSCKFEDPGVSCRYSDSARGMMICQDSDNGLSDLVPMEIPTYSNSIGDFIGSSSTCWTPSGDSSYSGNSGASSTIVTVSQHNGINPLLNHNL